MSYQTKTLRERFDHNYYATRNYQDYLSRKFDGLAAEIARATSMTFSARILDFGCGFGGLTNAFWLFGYRKVTGTDISQWAIEEGHRRFPKLKRKLQFYNRDLLRNPHEVLLLLDVLEHMPEYEIENVLKLARQGCRGSIVARIPVSAVEGEPYVLPVSNNDPTHITCHPKSWWLERFASAGFPKFTAFSGVTIYDSPGVLAGMLI